MTIAEDGWPAYDRAPSKKLMNLCREGGLLHPLVQLNREPCAKQHQGVPLDVHFRKNEMHVYCGHARIVKATYVSTREEVRLESEYTGNHRDLFKYWDVETCASILSKELGAYLENVDVDSRAEGEGRLQALWGSRTISTSVDSSWDSIDREVQLRFPNNSAKDQADERANVEVERARRVVFDIARRGTSWALPRETGNRLDQMAVDGEGNLVLIEIKDAEKGSPAELFYAPLQLLRYVHIWHSALMRLRVWEQVQNLVAARCELGLSSCLPKLSGGIRAAVCFGSFGDHPSREVKRRFYEVLGVVNSHLPSGVCPIETWCLDQRGEPRHL